MPGRHNKPRKKYKQRKTAGLGTVCFETREKEIAYLTRKSTNPNNGYLPTLEEIEELKAQIREENAYLELTKNGILEVEDQVNPRRNDYYKTYSLHIAGTGARRGIVIK